MRRFHLAVVIYLDFESTKTVASNKRKLWEYLLIIRAREVKKKTGNNQIQLDRWVWVLLYFLKVQRSKQYVLEKWIRIEKSNYRLCCIMIMHQSALTSMNTRKKNEINSNSENRKKPNAERKNISKESLLENLGLHSDEFNGINLYFSIHQSFLFFFQLSSSCIVAIEMHQFSLFSGISALINRNRIQKKLATLKKHSQAKHTMNGKDSRPREKKISLPSPNRWEYS